MMIDNLKEYEKRFTDIERSIEFEQKTIHDMKKQLETVMKSDKEKEKIIAELSDENKSLRQRVNWLDDLNRRSNLRFVGVPEQPGETSQMCQATLTTFINNHLGIEPTFDVVHRVGRLGEKVHRDILAKFSNSMGRDAVFQNKKKLRGTKIFMNEDLCQDSVDVRKMQMEDFHAARRQGKHVFFNNRNKLIIKNIQNRNDQTYHSAPGNDQPRTSMTYQGPPPNHRAWQHPQDVRYTTAEVHQPGTPSRATMTSQGPPPNHRAWQQPQDEIHTAPEVTLVDSTPSTAGIEINLESTSTAVVNLSPPVSEDSSHGRDQIVTDNGNAADTENSPLACHDAKATKDQDQHQVPSTRQRKPTSFYQHPC